MPAFPTDVRLLEEPQAAFYWWLEQGDWVESHGSKTALLMRGFRHVLVVDIGGGTTDFTLFEIAPKHRGGRFRASKESPSAITFFWEATISIWPLLIGSNRDCQLTNPFLRFNGIFWWRGVAT